jgi:hypothetical protein
MVRPPAGGQDAAPKARRWYHRPRADWRNPTTVTMRYRGGAAGWVEVRARGSVGRFHGATAIVDVLAEITQQDKR